MKTPLLFKLVMADWQVTIQQSPTKTIHSTQLISRKQPWNKTFIPEIPCNFCFYLEIEIAGTKDSFQQPGI